VCIKIEDRRPASGRSVTVIWRRLNSLSHENSKVTRHPRSGKRLTRYSDSYDWQTIVIWRAIMQTGKDSDVARQVEVD